MRTVLAVALLAAACSGAGGDDDPMCTGAKCDVPDDPGESLCPLRRADAFNPNQLAFAPDALRWSCNDALGVTAEDRGQEYCEYFAIVQPPAGGEPVVLGRNLGADSSDGTTEVGLELDSADLEALEADDAAVVGQCIFTSWNSDIPGAAPACSPSCPEVFGVPLKVETFRMKFDVNSAEAARMLVEDCYREPSGGDPGDPDDPLHDDFTRGCLLNDAINETAFRKSDSTVCAATMRMAECGCTVEGGLAALADAISPAARRGFPLGTWSSPTTLPPGCRHVDPGDGSQTVVACDLTASDLLAAAPDPKGRCRDKYGDNVVVHVPIDAAAIWCEPPADGRYADTCGDQPWVVTP